MIVSLRGKLLRKDPTTSVAVVECQGIGFGVAMSRRALETLGEVGDEAHVLVHTHMSQESARLYGFIEAGERQAFEDLLLAPGVGPKLALVILGAMSPAALRAAVEVGDKAALTRIPGVGGKKAERLLVELRGRLQVCPAVAWGANAPLESSTRADLLSALHNLGFAPEVAQQAATHALTRSPEGADLTTLLRQALRATAPRQG